MNTVQKAQDWLDAQSSWSNSDAHKIITALLAEREALIAEIDGLPRWGYVMGMIQISKTGRNVDAELLFPLLDKYRGEK